MNVYAEMERTVTVTLDNVEARHLYVALRKSKHRHAIKFVRLLTRLGFNKPWTYCHSVRSEATEKERGERKKGV